MHNLQAQIELFHLVFLRQLSAQIDASFYAIKGGCNLRFFFDSVRYSEDLDIDVCTIHKQTLENKVNKILKSLPLLKSLIGYGITQIEVTSPQQTLTTQRWKVRLNIENAQLPCHTKIEFSRRNKRILSEFANVSRRICQTYRLSPLRLSHYGLAETITQKILALANRSLTQARDIFDLYHLLHIAVPPNLLIQKSILTKAQNALLSIGFGDYKSQVVNFLELNEQLNFASEDYWQTISTEVLNYLSGLEQ